MVELLRTLGDALLLVSHERKFAMVTVQGAARLAILRAICTLGHEFFGCERAFRTGGNTLFVKQMSRLSALVAAVLVAIQAVLTAGVAYIV